MGSLNYLRARKRPLPAARESARAAILREFPDSFGRKLSKSAKYYGQSMLTAHVRKWTWLPTSWRMWNVLSPSCGRCKAELFVRSGWCWVSRDDQCLIYSTDFSVMKICVSISDLCPQWRKHCTVLWSSEWSFSETRNHTNINPHNKQNLHDQVGIIETFLWSLFSSWTL